MDISNMISLLLKVSFILVADALTPDEIEVFTTNGVTMDLANNLITFTSDGLPKKINGKTLKNAIAHTFNMTIPFDPSPVEPNPKVCLPPDIIGMTVHGVPIYNPYNSDCCSAGLAEKDSMDECGGKLDKDNRYYYNVPPLCEFKHLCNEEQLIGVALDGFPIYGPYDETGAYVDVSALDACHGRFDNKRSYRYHVSDEFPYVIGCFRAAPAVPTQCGCEFIRPNCTTADFKEFIEEQTCCSDASQCEFLSFKSGSTRSKAGISLILSMLVIFSSFLRHA